MSEKRALSASPRKPAGTDRNVKAKGLPLTSQKHLNLTLTKNPTAGSR
jgi:hypothetical protein